MYSTRFRLRQDGKDMATSSVYTFPANPAPGTLIAIANELSKKWKPMLKGRPGAVVLAPIRKHAARWRATPNRVAKRRVSPRRNPGRSPFAACGRNPFEPVKKGSIIQSGDEYQDTHNKQWYPSKSVGSPVGIKNKTGLRYRRFVKPSNRNPAGDYFSSAQLKKLRAAFFNIKGFPPDKLETVHKIFNRTPDTGLKQLAGTTIPFISKLAVNEMVRRGLTR